MKQRDFLRLLRQTNVEDLLDDGIENGSDLKTRKPVDEAGETASPALPGSDTTPSLNSHLQPLESDKATPEPERSSANWFGTALGIGMVVAGIFVFAKPHAIVLIHEHTRRHTSLEYVSSIGSQDYGVLAIIFGVAVCFLSLYRPRD